MPANYILLERIELNASAASVTFANIPQTGYTDLKLVISARTTRALETDAISLSLNGVATNQTSRYIEGTGTGVTWGSLTSFRTQATGATATANTFGNSEFYIPNYTGNTFKSASSDGVSENNATAAYAWLVANLWSSTAAITSITVTDLNSADFVANSTFSLYGLAAVGTTPVIAPKATGGNIIDFDGTYWIHTFLTSGTFTPSTSLSCDYLVVAGGGSGGGFQEWGGGGGAGGVRCTVGATGGGGSLESALSLSTGNSYTVTIGAGGAGKTAGGSGNNGSNSVFASITSTGGGGGGGETRSPETANAAGTGGSGGGAAVISNSGWAGTSTGAIASPSGQGYAGGNGYNYTTAGDSYNYSKGGGGGGAGAVGQNGGRGTPSASPASPSGNGGNGITTSISGSSTTYGGGGGAGAYFTTILSSGGSGGGGTGGNSNNTNGSNGTVNSGGGGGGNGTSTTGAGGSGIVIIRYLA